MFRNSPKHYSNYRYHFHVSFVLTFHYDTSFPQQGQQEKIDQIEDNIEKAHDNVQKGVWNLGKVSTQGISHVHGKVNHYWK